MVDTVTPPIVVSPNAGIIDLMTALGRYVIVIVTAIPLMLKLLGTHDLVAIISYFRSADGTALTAAVVGIGTLLYGLWKTHKRGAQIATVALSPSVPERVATTT